MNTTVISDTVKYANLAIGLRGFLRNKITLEESKRIISTRLQNRERNFLHLVQKGIYENPKSPYLKLLKLAGCEFGDIEVMVKKDGVEATLSALLAQGVYLSWEEFKMKNGITRGSSQIQFKETDLDNPFLPSHYYVQSSGSRSAGTRTMFDLKHELWLARYCLVFLAANNAMDVPLGLYMPILPSTAGIGNVLKHWVIGHPIARWFSPVTEKQVGALLRDKVAMRYFIYGGKLCGARLAKPEHVSLANAVKVARWIVETKNQFGGCSLMGFVSSVLKVCQAAIENELDIQGTHIFVGGEPVTHAKRHQMEAAGVSVVPRYHITEVGFIGAGCPESVAPDEVHFFNDSLALIQHQRKISHVDIDVNTFLFTSLSSTSPKVLLNVESDDYGVMENRNCGCLLQELGFNMHLHDIRSFSRLTGSGMTILGSSFVRILEEILPGKYGGSAADYQLVEEENDKGQTQISLAISPDVGEVDESDVMNTVFSELRQNVHGGRLAVSFWRQVDTLRLKRAYPLSSAGKVLTLHLMKNKK